MPVVVDVGSGVQPTTTVGNDTELAGALTSRGRSLKAGSYCIICLSIIATRNRILYFRVKILKTHIHIGPTADIIGRCDTA